jgi:hypothetical protein
MSNLQLWYSVARIKHSSNQALPQRTSRSINVHLRPTMHNLLPCCSIALASQPTSHSPDVRAAANTGITTINVGSAGAAENLDILSQIVKSHNGAACGRALNRLG